MEKGVKNNVIDLRGQPQTIKEMKELEALEDSRKSNQNTPLATGPLNYQNLRNNRSPSRNNLAVGYTSDR